MYNVQRQFAPIRNKTIMASCLLDMFETSFWLLKALTLLIHHAILASFEGLPHGAVSSCMLYSLFSKSGLLERYVFLNSY